MPRAAANGIELEYECFGDEGASPIVLIMGFAAQMIFWDEDFCRAIANRGFRVIRFDNRDVGLSTKVDALGTVNLAAAMIASRLGRPLQPPYTIDDMADDVVGLLDALGLESAHVCGASMGGMIAQTVAFRHPGRTRSLVSIMSTTGDPSLPQAQTAVTSVLLEPAPLDREGYASHSLKVWRAIGSPGFPFDEEGVRGRARRAFDRGIYPKGIVRQLTAILAHGSRRERLRGVRAPALVIHGEDDPLVPVIGAHDTASAIEGARLVVIPGMGHDLPRPAWPQIVAEIAEHARRAEASWRRRVVASGRAPTPRVRTSATAGSKPRPVSADGREGRVEPGVTVTAGGGSNPRRSRRDAMSEKESGAIELGEPGEEREELETIEEGEGVLVVDLEKAQSRKKIEKLRQGRGPLMDKVYDVLDELHAGGYLDDDVQPVVIVVREKPRDRSK